MPVHAPRFLINILQKPKDLRRAGENGRMKEGKLGRRTEPNTGPNNRRCGLKGKGLCSKLVSRASHTCIEAWPGRKNEGGSDIFAHHHVMGQAGGCQT